MDTIKAIKLAAKLAPKRGLPILGTVLLDFDAGVVRSTDLATQVEILIDSTGNRGRHLLDAAGARKLSSKAQFTILDDGKLQVTELGIVMPIVSDLPIDELPVALAVVDTSFRSVDHAPGLLKRALTFASNEPSRYQINMVSLNCGVAATDGLRLFASSGYTGAGQVTIPKPAAEIIAGLPDGTLRVRRKDNLVSLTLTGSDVQVTARIGDVDFPDVTQVIPTGAHVMIQTSFGDLEKWRAIKRSTTKERPHASAAAVWPECLASFNAGFMVEILATMPNAMLEFRDKDKPLVIRTTDAMALLMPVRWD